MKAMQMPMTSMPRRLGSLSVVLAITMICGCSKTVERSDVVGAYVASHAGGSERIELKADGTYIYKFKPFEGHERSNTDKWEFTVLDKEQKVVLYNFYSHFPPASPGGQVQLLGAEKHWGQFRLYVSYDRDQYYSKTSAQ
jgi:hypothetical protein